MKQKTVLLQCDNQILQKALEQLLKKVDGIQVLTAPSRHYDASQYCAECIVREEDELLRSWIASLHPHGNTHLYINTTENCITVTTNSRIELSNVSDLAELILNHQHASFVSDK